MTLVHRVEMNGMDMDWWMQEKLGNHQKQKTPPVVESVRIIYDNNGSAEDLNMSFYYDSGEYVVNVTAVDRTGLSGYNSTSLFYLPAIALELDADTIAFGSLDPGESREVLGDEDMSTPGYPTVWNTGNRI